MTGVILKAGSPATVFVFVVRPFPWRFFDSLGSSIPSQPTRKTAPVHGELSIATIFGVEIALYFIIRAEVATYCDVDECHGENDDSYYFQGRPPLLLRFDGLGWFNECTGGVLRHAGNISPRYFDAGLLFPHLFQPFRTG